MERGSAARLTARNLHRLNRARGQAGRHGQEEPGDFWETEPADAGRYLYTPAPSPQRIVEREIFLSHHAGSPALRGSKLTAHEECMATPKVPVYTNVLPGAGPDGSLAL